MHTTYVAEVDLGVPSRSRVFQVVCSPFRNQMVAHQRRIVAAAGSRLSARVFARLAGWAGVRPLDVAWTFSLGRSYDNSIGELVLDGPAAAVDLYRSTLAAGGTLERIGSVRLASAPTDDA